MSDLPLKALKWHDASGVDGVYSERTDSYIKDALWFCSTLVAEYVIRKKGDKYVVTYGGRTEPEYDTIDEAKHWAEHTHYASQMQPYFKPDSITDIANWFKKAKPEPTDKDIGTQTGCLLEEVVELLEGFGFAKQGAVLALHNLAGLFKANTFGGMISELSQEDRIDIVDACCDINVTSVGVMQLLGGVDVLGAQREVIRSNNSKFEDGKPLFNEQGKIMKGKDYSEPDLTPFISTMQSLHKGE